MIQFFLLVLTLFCFIPFQMEGATNAVPPGPRVFAHFVGRTPCREIANEMPASVPEECYKLKWDLTLFCDQANGVPTTYRIDATLYRQSPRIGKWRIVNGTAHHPGKVIYELEAASGHGPIQLLRGDENILFFVAHDGRLLVGNEKFSYTLNRAEENSLGD